MAKEVVKKAATIFDHIANLTNKKTPWDSLSEMDKKSYSPYMLNRWLSMHSDFIEIINYFQKYTIGTLSTRDSYKLLQDILPKQKTFSKYIKGKKSEKYHPDLIEYLKNHYLVSKKEVIDYIEIILQMEDGEKQLTSILQKYAVPEKEIIKLLKIQ
jgi:hypothetical protein